MQYECDINVRAPYPDIYVSKENPQYARILMRLYAGKDGELTGICQYTYQSIILGDTDEEAAELLECISVTEMKHFRMLGELIKLLGVNPKLMAPSRNRRFSWWSGEYVNYVHNTREIIEENIIGEKAGINSYNAAIRSIGDENVRAVLRRIVMDEERHVEIFSDLLRDYTPRR